MSSEQLLRDFQQLQASRADFWSLRVHDEQARKYILSRGKRLPARHFQDRGAFLSARVDGGIGYAATHDLSRQGLQRALQHAEQRAQLNARHGLVDYSDLVFPLDSGRYASPNRQHPLPAATDWYDLLLDEARAIPADSRLRDWSLEVEVRQLDKLYLTNQGVHIEQQHQLLTPGIQVTASHAGVTQTRTLNGGANRATQQGGLEVLAQVGFHGAAARIADEALQLILAPNCPDAELDLLLLPDQMNLQIHESIGHPLELDRILGDERNFAGSSFVSLDMFGHFRYGSPLLNITFDPGIAEEQASYAYDDNGLVARKAHLIKEGILLRPIGGQLSQYRAGIEGVASARANAWNRPVIDRMANLNLEPGDHDLAQLVGSIDDGILLQSNSSWSIDQQRNKFQFSCEYARRIRNGALAEVVRNPNYRGLSRDFWSNLRAVGDASTLEVVGTGCGKGEPSQGIRVGHASPACVFSNVSVFGGRQ